MDRELIRPCPRPGCRGCGVNECSDCGARTWAPTPTFDPDAPAPVKRPRSRISPMISVRLKRRLRCPMCRKAPRTLVEFITGSTEFVVLADGTARAADGYHEPGEYYRLDAVCGCGHRWRIKGEIQVTGLDAIVSPTGAGSAGR